MGMGYAACQQQAISYDDLKELCPNEVAAVESVEGFEGWGALAQSLWCDDQDIIRPFASSIEALCQAFNTVTSVDGNGLKLFVNYYDEDSGDRYDEAEHLDGCLFVIDGVYQMTPAALKFKEKIKHVSYVVFG